MGEWPRPMTDGRSQIVGSPNVSKTEQQISFIFCFPFFFFEHPSNIIFGVLVAQLTDYGANLSPV